MTPEESLELFGRTDHITLEQRKNRRKAFAERVGAILIPEGFVRQRNYFVRIHGDWVIQVVNLSMDNFTGSCEIGVSSHRCVGDGSSHLLYSKPYFPYRPAMLMEYAGFANVEKVAGYVHPGAKYVGHNVFWLVPDFNEALGIICRLLREKVVAILNETRDRESCNRLKARLLNKPIDINKASQERTLIDELREGEYDQAISQLEDSIEGLRERIVQYENFRCFWWRMVAEGRPNTKRRRRDVEEAESTERGIVAFGGEIADLREAIERIRQGDIEWIRDIIRRSYELVREDLNHACPKALKAFEAQKKS